MTQQNPASPDGEYVLGLHFIAGSVPPVKVGSMSTFVVMTHKDGKEFSFPAYYLNAWPLEYGDTCEQRGCPKGESHDDGCPTTGWFYDESNFEYDNCYHPIDGDVICYAAIPSAKDIKAALASAPRPDADEKLAEITALEKIARGFDERAEKCRKEANDLEPYQKGDIDQWLWVENYAKRDAATIRKAILITERAASLEHDLLIAHAAIIILKKAQAMKDRKLRKEAERGDTV